MSEGFWIYISTLTTLIVLAFRFNFAGVFISEIKLALTKFIALNIVIKQKKPETKSQADSK